VAIWNAIFGRPLASHEEGEQPRRSEVTTCSCGKSDADRRAVADGSRTALDVDLSTVGRDDVLDHQEAKAAASDLVKVMPKQRLHPRLGHARAVVMHGNRHVGGALIERDAYRDRAACRSARARTYVPQRAPDQSRDCLCDLVRIFFFVAGCCDLAAGKTILRIGRSSRPARRAPPLLL
jgi:hypothetical protein